MTQRHRDDPEGTTMKYALLLYSDEATEPDMTGPNAADELAPWMAFGEALMQAGAMLGGDALQPVATATSVQVRDGKTITSDGPFAETKEALGGFYLIEAADLDEATAWAAKVPSAVRGTVEIRPIMSFD